MAVWEKLFILHNQSRTNGDPELGSFTPRKVFLKGEALETVGVKIKVIVTPIIPWAGLRRSFHVGFGFCPSEPKIGSFVFSTASMRLVPIIQKHTSDVHRVRSWIVRCLFSPSSCSHVLLHPSFTQLCRMMYCDGWSSSSVKFSHSSEMTSFILFFLL